MNIDPKLHQILSNLDRTLPPQFQSVDDLVRAIDSRPAGEVDAWLDKLAPVVIGDDATKRKELRAALQAAITFAKDSGVPLAELKRRAVGRVDGAMAPADLRAPSGPGFTRPNDVAEQAQRLDTIKRDFLVKARAAGAPLPDIGLDEQFKNAGEAKAYVGQLLAGDMLYWARNAFEESARMEQAKSPAQLREVILGVDYSHFTGGGGPYHDYLLAKLDNNFSMADIVDVLSRAKFYRYPINVQAQVDALIKLLQRREGNDAAIESMLRDVMATGRDTQSNIVANSFLGRAAAHSRAAAAALDRLGHRADLTMYGPIVGQAYPDRSALESIAAIAAARPEFKAFEAALPQGEGKRVTKEALLGAIDAEIAKMKAPEEFVAFALALTGDRYKYQFSGGAYRSDRSYNILWDVMKKHPDTAARLGVSFDWLAALTFTAYFHSVHMAQSGMLFEDAMKVLQPTMAHLKTPEQLDRLMASADLFIQKTYINSRDHYPDNYRAAWQSLRNTAVSKLVANFATPAEGPAVVARCATVDAAIMGKYRMLQLAGDDLRGALASMELHFANPSDAYLKDNEQFVLKHLPRVTGHRAFDRGALEALLAVQNFSRPALEAILRATERAANFANWSVADQDAVRARLASA